MLRWVQAPEAGVVEQASPIDYRAIVAGWRPARGGSSGGDAILESKLNMSIAELKLSVRATNCLES